MENRTRSYIRIGTILLVGFIIGQLFCCNKESESIDVISYEKRINNLEAKITQKEQFVDLLNSELISINSTLDSINEEYLDDDNLIIDPVIKILKFDSLLISSSQRINDLEKLAAKRTSNSDTRLLNSVISELKSKLIEKEKEIAILKFENDSLKITSEIKSDSIFNLTELKSRLLADIAKQEGKLDSVRTILEEEKNDLKKEKESLKEDLEKSIEQINIEKRNSYFEFAKELFDEYNNTSANFLQGGLKKMKVQLINSAYNYFRKACLLGHPQASGYIRRLLNDKKYYKDLDIKRTAASISKCGI